MKSSQASRTPDMKGVGRSRLTSSRGRLAKSALERHRKKWKQVISAYIDEISMVAADQLLQCDVRLRQAKLRPQERFGNLGINLCGDFLVTKFSYSNTVFR